MKELSVSLIALHNNTKPSTLFKFKQVVCIHSLCTPQFPCSEHFPLTPTNLKVSFLLLEFISSFYQHLFSPSRSGKSARRRSVSSRHYSSSCSGVLSLWPCQLSSSSTSRAGAHWSQSTLSSSPSPRLALETLSPVKKVTWFSFVFMDYILFLWVAASLESVHLYELFLSHSNSVDVHRSDKRLIDQLLHSAFQILMYCFSNPFESLQNV